MSRGLSPSLLSKLSADNVDWCLLFKAEFDSGTVRMWTGLGEITYDGEIYLGGGNLLEWSGVGETMGTDAIGTTVTLSGIPSELLSIALQEDYQNRPAQVILAVLNEDGQIEDDVIDAFSGRMDVMSGTDSGQTSAITVSLESDMNVFQIVDPRWYSPASQEKLFPGDRGFQYVASLMTLNIRWGD